MAAWLELLTKAEKFLDSGKPDKASELLRKGIRKYKSETGVTQWYLFHLMRSQRLIVGPEAAQHYLIDIINTDLTWSAKLYTLEMALESAQLGDDNLDELYNNVVYAVEKYIHSELKDDEINIMSCCSVARHIHRLYDFNKIGNAFLYSDNEEDYPIEYCKKENPSAPNETFHCNRIPNIIKLNIENYTPPIRGLGFRNVGKAFIIRIGNNTALFDGNGHLLPVPYGPLPIFLKKYWKTNLRRQNHPIKYTACLYL